MLPPALASWQPELRALPRQLVLDLQPLLPHLAALLGPMHAPPVQGQGEPDGMDGLDRRGPYERLVASEWLLADEVPIEFLRRAVDGEHLFSRVRRIEPTATRHCVVLLDTGPETLGAPRLVQLVAWLALARRARMAGATFQWGIVQQPARGLSWHLNLGAVRRWRAARTLSPPDVSAWADRLDPLGQDDERWWIGGSALGRPDGARVVLREPLSLERVVSLQLDRNGTSQTTQVPLPDPIACIRAFRQKLIPPSAQTPLDDVAACLGWSQDGRRLLIVRADGTGESVHVPTRGMLARQPAGRTRRCPPPPDGALLALGHVGRSVEALAWQDGHLLRWGLNRWERWLPAPQVVERQVPGKLWTGSPSVFQDGNQTVWSVHDALIQLHAGPGHLVAMNPGWLFDPVAQTLTNVVAGSTLTDVDGCVSGNRYPVAYRTQGAWRTTASAKPLAEDVRGHVLGALTLSGAKAPDLVVHHDGQLLLQGLQRTHVLAQVPDPIQGLWVNPRRAVLAWRTQDGALSVLDVESAQFLMRPGDPAEGAP